MSAAAIPAVRPAVLPAVLPAMDARAGTGAAPANAVMLDGKFVTLNGKFVTLTT